MNTANAFWQWFRDNAFRISTEFKNERVKSISNEIGAALQRVNARLRWEVSREQGKEWVFCISADGDPELFPVVTQLVEAAPEVAGWRIAAFRQRGKIDVEIHMGDHVLGPNDIWFTAEKVLGRVDLTLWIRGLDETNDSILSRAALILLDNAVGEYDAVMTIGALGRGPLPDNAEACAGLMPLRALPAYVDALKATFN